MTSKATKLAPQLKVTQVKSVIGRPQKQRLVLKGLGLRRIGGCVTVANTPSFRGAIRKVLHLVSVEEVSGTGVQS